MSNLIKIIVVFVVCIISFTLSVIIYENDEYSPFVFIFTATGIISFIVSLVGFLII